MPESSGLMESLMRMAGTVLAIFQTRLELLSNEMEEERVRIGQKLLYSSIALFFSGLTVLLFTMFIVVLFWDSYRLPVLGGFIGLYFVVGLVAWNALRRVTGEKSRLFSASLAELADDRSRFAPRP